MSLVFKNLPVSLEDNGGMWLGIGFGATTMLNADIVMCQWNDATAKAGCTDHKALSTVSNVFPPYDTTNNVRFISGIKADNQLEIKFRRYINTGDSTDATLNPGDQLSLIWAFGYPDKAYHGSNNRGI